jgi:hypothetical protein
MMRAIKRIGLLLDLLILAASLTAGASGPKLGAVVVACLWTLGALVVVAAVGFGIALRDQRQPPFPMVGDRP